MRRVSPKVGFVGGNGSAPRKGLEIESTWKQMVWVIHLGNRLG